MLRMALNFTKLGAMGYISHLDFQRLWQRLFRIAGMEVAQTQGFNPHPRIRFAVPLATGFESESELLEVYLNQEINGQELVKSLNNVSPQGLNVIAASQIPDQYPKLTALVDALEYQVKIPGEKIVRFGEVSDEVETKGGILHLSEYLLAKDVSGCTLKFLIKAENQKTLRPDVIAQHLYPNCNPGQFKITRTGIYTSRDIPPRPQGLSLMFD